MRSCDCGNCPGYYLMAHRCTCPCHAGPREATRADLPQGKEAQCPICWRLFTSDAACEKHKPYRKPKSLGCKVPSTIGMKAVSRRGLAIWTRPMPADVLDLRRVRNGADPMDVSEPLESEQEAYSRENSGM